MKNVLVFPCGSEIGLEIYRCLEFSKNFKVFGASTIDDCGRLFYKNYLELPWFSEANFIPELNRKIKENNIDFIIPAHDSVGLLMAQNKRQIKAQLVCHPLKTHQICRSKRATYQTLSKTLEKSGFHVPEVLEVDEKTNFPIFAKPDSGQGSYECFKIDSFQEFQATYKRIKNHLFLEYLPGFEYTIDCFSGYGEELLAIIPRLRASIIKGISNYTHNRIDKRTYDNLIKIASLINSKIKFRGPWFFQVKKNSKNILTLLEVAPRIAGSSGLSRVLGVNFIQLALFDLLQPGQVKILQRSMVCEYFRPLGEKYILRTIDKPDWDNLHNLDCSKPKSENLYRSSESVYKKVFVDFDDTLIVEGRLNGKLVGLLINERNKGKDIYLLTRNNSGVENILNKIIIEGLSENFFKNIFVVPQDKSKKDFLDNTSILIDDSFQERLDCGNARVFGTDNFIVLD
jgi:hypothetical protein